MITKSQVEARIKVRTSKRLPPDQQDTGRVIDHNHQSVTGHEVFVAWASGVSTWIERSKLFAA